MIVHFYCSFIIYIIFIAVGVCATLLELALKAYTANSATLYTCTQFLLYRLIFSVSPC